MKIDKSSIKALELGCGFGNWSVLMAKHNRNIDVTATDISQTNIDITNLHAERNQVEINSYTCSCDSTGSSDNYFDIILAIYSLLFRIQFSYHYITSIVLSIHCYIVISRYSIYPA